MANTGKKQGLKDLDEQTEMIEKLVKLSPKALENIELSPNQVSIATGRKISTLETDRAKRRAALKNNTPIAANSPISLVPIEPDDGSREVKYSACELLDYFKRRREISLKGSPAKQDPMAGTQMRGFGAWLSSAMPMDEWPFSIQDDGRPINLADAIVSGLITENCKRLTLSEFTYELMHASNNAFSKFEQAEIEKIAKKPARKAAAGKKDPL